MGPTLPLNSDLPNGDSHDEFRVGDGNGPPPLIIDILDSSESDEDVAAGNNFIGYVGANPDALIETVPNNIGYELLSQDTEYFADANIPSHDDEEEETGHGDAYFTLVSNNTSQHDDELLQENNMTSTAASEIENRCNSNTDEPKESMDPDHIEKIKNVMKSVKLPACNLPEWSQFVPEEKWKCVLMEKLHVTDSLTPNSLIAESSMQPSSSNSGLRLETHFSNLRLSKDSLNSPESQITDVSSSNSPSIRNSSNAPSMEELSNFSSSANQGDAVGD